jgi:hypothetical protein
MIKMICSILVFAMMSCAAAKATEPVGLELRKRNSIGRLGLFNVQVAVKTKADGSAGKTAKAIKVEKSGPVTAQESKN